MRRPLSPLPEQRIVRGDAMGNGGIENGVVAAAADAVWGKMSDLNTKDK